MATTSTPAPRAGSNYRQLRLTLTESREGYWSGPFLLKPFNAEWQYRHHLLTLRTNTMLNPQSPEDGLLVIESAIANHTIPLGR